MTLWYQTKGTKLTARNYIYIYIYMHGYVCMYVYVYFYTSFTVLLWYYWIEKVFHTAFDKTAQNIFQQNYFSEICFIKKLKQQN